VSARHFGGRSAMGREPVLDCGSEANIQPARALSRPMFSAQAKFPARSMMSYSNVQFLSPPLS
jgi:hypothetical protein